MEEPQELPDEGELRRQRDVSIAMRELLGPVYEVADARAKGWFVACFRSNHRWGVPEDEGWRMMAKARTAEELEPLIEKRLTEAGHIESHPSNYCILPPV